MDSHQLLTDIASIIGAMGVIGPIGWKASKVIKELSLMVSAHAGMIMRIENVATRLEKLETTVQALQQERS